MKYLIVLLYSFSVFAGDPSFSLLHKRRFDKAYYKITFKDKKWVCQTNHFPYYEASENPLAQLNWIALEKESESVPKPCKEPVALENGLDGKSKKRIVTCFGQKETLSLYERVSRLCRPKI